MQSWKLLEWGIRLIKADTSQVYDMISQEPKWVTDLNLWSDNSSGYLFDYINWSNPKKTLNFSLLPF